MPGGTDKMTKDVRSSLRSVAAKGGRYFKGTAALFLASGSEFVGNQLPTVGAFVETNRDLLQDTARFLRNPVDTVNRTINKAMSTDDFKALQKFAKNALDDLKSGELYDPDRMRSGFGETIDSLLDDFGDVDMSGFGEDGSYTEPEGSDEFEREADLVESQEEAADTRTSATIEAIGMGTEALAQTANANAQTNIRLSLKQHSQIMAGMQNMVTQQAATLQAVNQTAVSILDVTREAHQQIMSGMAGITTILQKIEQNTTPAAPERATAREELEIIGPNGELNITNWLKQVRKNADDKYNISSMLTMATGGMGISQLLEQVGDNPWQLVSDALLQRMLPPSLKKQFETTGKKLEGFFPALLSKLNDRGKKYGSGESEKLTDLIAGLFGVEERSRRTIDTSTRDPSAQALFTNRTAQAIEQVIPMWLSKIHTALTGADEQVFDYGTGKFTRVVDVLAQTSNNVNDLANRMGSAASNFLDLARSVKFEDVEMEEDFNKYLYRYLQRQAETGQFIDPWMDKQKFKDTMPSGAQNEELYYNIITSALQKMDRADLLSLSSEIQSARQSRHRANAAINNRLRDNGTLIAFGDSIDKRITNAVINGSQETAYGLRGDDLKKVMDKEKANAIARGGQQAANVHLDNIESILKRGIITYTYIMGSEFSGAALPDHIVKGLDLAKKDSEATYDRDSKITEIEKNRSEREKEDQKRRRDARREKYEHSDQGGGYVNGDTDKGYIEQLMTNTRLRERIGPDSLFDNPELERSERGTYEAGQRRIREEMARRSREINQRLDGGKFGDLIDTAREYGKVPFELVENGLKLVDSFLFRVLYGEDASEVLLNEHKLPSILDAVRINVKAQWLEAGNWFAKNIGDPIRYRLLDENEGLIPRIGNRLNEILIKPAKEKATEYKRKLIGTRELDADGKPIGDYTGGRFSDAINSVRHRAAEITGGMKDSLTGGQRTNPDGTPKMSRIDKLLWGSEEGKRHKGRETVLDTEEVDYGDRIVTEYNGYRYQYHGFVGAIKKVGDSFMDMMLGPDPGRSDANLWEPDTHDSRRKFNMVAGEVKKAFPDMTIGAGVGILGSLFLPGGPLLGAILGSAGGFVASSEKFKEYLFGEEIAEDTQMRFNYATGKIEETKVRSRKGGIIDKTIYDAFKKFAPNIAVGSGLGIIGSLFLPGGPMIGALMGGIGGMVSASDQMKEALFGSEVDENGNEKSLLGPKTRAAIKNAVGPALGGAALGGAAWSMISSIGIIPGLSLLPGGPIFTLLGGITGAMNADAIKNFFFGEETESTEEIKDENGNVTGVKKSKKRVGGLFGRAFDFAKTKMLEPFAERINKAGAKVGEWFNESVVAPFRNAMQPLREQMKRAGTAISDSMKNIGERIKESIDKVFEKNIGQPLGDFFKEKVITPLDNAVKKIFSTLGKVIGSIISAPFKALEFVATGTIGGKDLEELQDERAAARKAKQAERDKARADRIKSRLGRIWGDKGVGGRLRKLFGKYMPGQSEGEPETPDESGSGSGDSLTGANGEQYVRNSADKWINAKTKRSVSNADVEAAQASGSTEGSDKRRGIPSRIFGGRDKDSQNLGTNVNRNRNRERIVSDEAGKKDKQEAARNDERERLARNEERKRNNASAGEGSDSDAKTKDSTTPEASAAEDGGPAKRSKLRGKSNNEYLKSMDKHISGIYSEIKGQLGGSGWNIAYIKTLLDKQFGKLSDEELPEEMEGSKKVKKHRGFFGRMFDRVSDGFNAITGRIGDAIGGVVDLVLSPFEMIGKAVGLVKDAITGAAETIWSVTKTIGSIIGEVLKDTAEALGEVMIGVGETIRAAAPEIGSALGDVLKTFTGVLSDGILATSSVVCGLVETAATVAPDIAATAWEGMKTVAGLVGKGASFLAKGTIDGITGLFGKIFGGHGDSEGKERKIRSKKIKIDGPVPITIYDQGDGPDYVQYPFISTISPVMPSRAIPVFLVGAFADAIVTTSMGAPDPDIPETPDTGEPASTGRSTGASPASPGSGGSPSGSQSSDSESPNPDGPEPGAEGGGARPTNGTIRSRMGESVDKLRTSFGDLMGQIRNRVAPKKGEGQEEPGEHRSEKSKKSSIFAAFKRKYFNVDAKAERSKNPAEAYDDAMRNATSMEEVQAIQAAQQMNANGQEIEIAQQEQKKSSIFDLLLGGLASLFGGGGLKGLMTAIGGTTAGKAVGGFLSKTALPFLGEAAGMAATGYQFLGENGNKLWGAETVAMDALKIGRAVAGSADDVAALPPIKKAITKLIKALTTNATVVKMFGAMKNRLGTLASKLANKIGGEVLEEAMKSGAKQAQGAIKQIAAFASGGTIAIAFAIADFVAGFGNAKKYFNVFGSDVSLGMRLTSGIVNTLGGLLSLIPGIGPLLSVAAAMFQDSIVQMVYGVLADDAAKEELAANQQKLQAATDQYNAENGTNLTVDEYAKKFNEDGSKRGILSTIGGGLKSVGGAVVGGAKKLGGAIVGGAKKVGDFALNVVKGVPDFIANGANWIGNAFETVGTKLNEFVTNLPETISKGIDGLFGKIGDVLTNLPTTVGKFIGDTVGGVIKAEGGITEFAIKLGRGIINGAIKIAGGLGNMLLGIAKGIGNILLSGVKLIFETPEIIGNIAVSIGKGIINTIGAAIGGVNNLIAEIVKGIGNAIKEALGGIGDAIDEAIGDIPVVGDVYKGAKGLAKGAKDIVDAGLSAADSFVDGIPVVGSVYRGAKDLASKADDVVENIPLLGGLYKGAKGLLGGSDKEESGSGAGWGKGPDEGTLVTSIASKVATSVGDMINTARTTADGNGLDVSSLGGFVKSAFRDPKALMSTFLSVGKGIGGSLIEMVTDVFKGKKNGPIIFSIMGEGLGNSLIADLKNTEGKNATITDSMYTAMAATVTGKSSSTTKKKKGFFQKAADTVSGWMPWNWGKGEGCDNCDEDWGTGRVQSMSQSSGKWNRGSDAMAKAGCGPTAAAMVASAYGAKGANPMEANKMSLRNGMRANDGGTNPKFFGQYASAHGYGMSEGPVDPKTIAGNLTKGQPVVVMGKGGAFGKNMHYMVAERETGRGGVGIVDPLTGARKSTTMGSLIGNTKTAIYSWGKGPESQPDLAATPEGGAYAGSAVDDIWQRGSTTGGSAALTSDGTTPTEEKAKTGGNPLNKAYKVTSGFGYRNLGGNASSYHKGVDLVPTDGSRQADVGSRWNGEISYVVKNVPNSHTGLNVTSNLGGNMVWIKTDEGYTVKHMHLKHGTIPDAIVQGAKVTVGQKLGEMGTTGCSTGPHLHYQLEDANGKAFDPSSSVSGGDTMASFTNGATTSSGADTSGTASGSTAGYSSSGDTSGGSSSGGIKMPMFEALSSALSTIFSGISNKFGNILSVLMGGSPGDSDMEGDPGGKDTSGATTSGGSTFNFGSSAGTTDPTEAKNTTWKWLRRSFGLTEPGAAGIMGCWQAESSNNPATLEGSYLKAWRNKYSSVDEVMSSNANLNDYTVNYLFPAYDRSGISISKSGYRMADGNYYPGVGLAQWTKGRAYNLLKFAQENGLDWRNVETQLKFFQHETSASYPKLKDALNAASTPEEGARAALDGFEMYSGWSNTERGQKQLAVRAKHAAQIYNTYKGTSTLTEEEQQQVQAGSNRRNWGVDNDGNITVPYPSKDGSQSAEGATVTGEDGTTGSGSGWGTGPVPDLSYNATALNRQIAEINKNMQQVREEATAETTVAAVTKKITDAMTGDTSGSSDDQAKALVGIAQMMAQVVELLSDIRENTKQQPTTGTEEEKDSKKFPFVPTASPYYPNGSRDADDVGAVTIDRLTGL